jgi:hypothetical protein
MRHRILDLILAFTLIGVMVAEQFVNLEAAGRIVTGLHLGLHVVVAGALMFEATQHWHGRRNVRA